MSQKVHLRPEAQADVEDAASWYEQQQEDLGKEFLDEIVRTLSTLQENPLLYPVVHKEVRRALIRRFPFGIYYLIESEEIVVIGIMHGSRDPKVWKSRT